MASSSSDRPPPPVRRPWKQQRIDVARYPVGARLQQVINTGSTSDMGLATIMARLCSDVPDRCTMSRIRHAKLDSVRHVIRVPLEKGGEFDWVLCHPGLLLTRIVGESVALQSAFKEALCRRPCTRDRPWGLLVGFDEHVPGSKLALQPRRKAMNLSFSFLELGGNL